MNNVLRLFIELENYEYSKISFNTFEFSRVLSSGNHRFCKILITIHLGSIMS
jgi:hypothetical protein